MIYMKCRGNIRNKGFLLLSPNHRLENPIFIPNNGDDCYCILLTD